MDSLGLMPRAKDDVSEEPSTPVSFGDSSSPLWPRPCAVQLSSRVYRQGCWFYCRILITRGLDSHAVDCTLVGKERSRWFCHYLIESITSPYHRRSSIGIAREFNRLRRQHHLCVLRNARDIHTAVNGIQSSNQLWYHSSKLHPKKKTQHNNISLTPPSHPHPPSPA